MNVFLISSTNIKWDDYLKIATEVLGRSPTVKINESWRKIKQDLSDYLSTLKEIETPDSNPFSSDCIKGLLDHIHLTFIVVATKSSTLKLVVTSRLFFTVAESKHDDFYLSIVSGTLSQFRTALINCCSDENQIDIRLFGTKLLEQLELLDIKQFLSDVIKIPMADGTIRLIEK